MKEKKMKKLLLIIIVGLLLLFLPVGVIMGAPPPKKTPQLLQAAKKLFEVSCTPCHGPKGDGKGVVGSALTPPPNDFTKPLGQWPTTKGIPQKVFEAISKGIANTGMVKWDQFTEEERWGLAYYVMEFSKP
jgi:high-affinity iron transporter